jgi:hypothetical protein
MAGTGRSGRCREGGFRSLGNICSSPRLPVPVGVVGLPAGCTTSSWPISLSHDRAVVKLDRAAVGQDRIFTQVLNDPRSSLGAVCMGAGTECPSGKSQLEPFRRRYDTWLRADLIKLTCRSR